MKSDNPLLLTVRNVDLKAGELLFGEVQNLENQSVSNLEEILQTFSTISVKGTAEEGSPEILAMQPGAQTVRIRKTADGFQVNLPDDPQAGNSQFSEVQAVRDFLFNRNQENQASSQDEDKKALPASSKKSNAAKGLLLIVGIVIMLLVWIRNFQAPETMTVALPEYEPIHDQSLVTELNEKWIGTYYSQPQGAFVLNLKADRKAEFYPELEGVATVETPTPYDFQFGRVENQTVIVIPQLGIFVPSGDNTLNFDYQSFVRKPLADEAGTEESSDS